MPDCSVAEDTLRSQDVAPQLSERGARVRRVKWVELSCLLCGEWAATIEGGTLLRPRAVGSARIAGSRVVCGRCGGGLSPTDQGERVHFV